MIDQSKISNSESWGTFLGFVAISALEIFVLFEYSLPPSTFKDWIIFGGAILFPVGAILSLIGILKNWSVEESDNAFSKTFGLILATPFIIALLGFIVWLLYNFVGWLATIPLWAAVIIVLLLSLIHI